MTHKVMIANPIELLGTTLERFGELIPGLITTGNFEQVHAMAKLGEISHLCILVSAYNVSESKFNNVVGQGAAEIIHAIRPEIPILIWNGRDMEWKEQAYKWKPVKGENEIYLRLEDYEQEDLFRLTKMFYAGSLTSENMPCRATVTTDSMSQRF